MAISILPDAWDVPQEFRDRLGVQVGRQRVMVADGHLLLVLHAPPKPDEHQRTGRFFWRAPDGSWSSNAFGSGMNALNKHLDEYQKLFAGLIQREDMAKTSDELFAILELLVPLCRASRNLHQVLQVARKTCPEIREIIDFRDRSYEIERTGEILYNGVKNALDFAVARRAEEHSRAAHQMSITSHRLNCLVAFFFPIATLTAIFGVNLRHGLEDYPPPGAFLGVIAVGLLLGVVLAAVVNRTIKPRE